MTNTRIRNEQDSHRRQAISRRLSFCRQKSGPPFRLSERPFAPLRLGDSLGGWGDLRLSTLSAVSPDERARTHLCDLLAALRLCGFLGVLVVKPTRSS